MIDTINKIGNREYLFVMTIIIFLFDVFTHSGAVSKFTEIALVGFVMYTSGQADGRASGGTK
jgi:hypothetical protein